MKGLSCRSCLLLVALSLAPPLPAADDVRVNQLTIEVRDLQRALRDQARRIDELERALVLYRQPGPRTSSRGEPLKPPGEQWLQSKNWARLRPGMTAQEVIAILGAPASTREVGEDTRFLLYAMQLGASGYLGGSVTIRNDRVIDVSRPMLK